MDSYFKIQRAREEIVRLNNEICRLVTWINDEDQFLRRREAELSKMGDTAMAVLVQRYRRERGRSDMGHMKRFWRLAKTPGFTGCILPGLSKEARDLQRAQRRREREAEQEEGGRGGEGLMDVDEEDEEEAVITIDMAAGWEPPPQLEDGWVDVDRGDGGEEMDEEDEGEEEAEKELSAIIYDLARVSMEGKGADLENEEEEGAS
jgi:hypothetical protein